MRKLFAAIIAMGCLAGLVAVAEEPAKPAAKAAKETVHRLVWEHAEKLCQFVDKGDEAWVEVDKDGKPTFSFKEARRNCDFVELSDRSRGLTVRLYKDAMFMKGGPIEDFTKQYDGKWAK